MYQTADTPLRKTARPQLGRRRRKDDATFVAIGGLLALFFLVQFGWVILGQPHL